MNKIQDFERILKSGTAKKKALLIASHAALKTTKGEGLLSEREVSALVDSIRLPNESRIYDRIVNAEFNVRVAIPSIRGSYFYIESLKNLVGQYCYIEDVVGKITDNLNALIFDEGETSAEAERYSETGDPKASAASKKKRLAMRDKILKHVKPFLMKLEPHEEVFIKAEQDQTIKKNLPLLSERLRRQTIVIKSRISAIRDFLEEQEAKIKPYFEFLAETEDNLRAENYPFGYRYGMKAETKEDAVFMERIKKLNEEKQRFYRYDDLPIDENIKTHMMGFLKV